MIFFEEFNFILVESIRSTVYEATFRKCSLIIILGYSIWNTLFRLLLKSAYVQYLPNVEGHPFIVYESYT